MSSLFAANQLSEKVMDALDNHEIPSRLYLFGGFGVVSIISSFLFCCIDRPSISDIEGHIEKEDDDLDGKDCKRYYYAKDNDGTRTREISYSAKVLKNTQVYNDASSFKEIERTWKYMLSPKMLKLFPAIIWTSVSFSMVKEIFPELVERALENSYDEYPKVKADEDLQDEMVFQVLAFLGIG